MSTKAERSGSPVQWSSAPLQSTVFRHASTKDVQSLSCGEPDLGLCRLWASAQTKFSNGHHKYTSIVTSAYVDLPKIGFGCVMYMFAEVQC